MDDLDDMLFEAAGRTARDDDPPPSSRRRRKGSYSDDGSDSRDDDRGYAKGVSPLSSIPEAQPIPLLPHHAYLQLQTPMISKQQLLHAGVLERVVHAQSEVESAAH
ncbi:hypothetical protein Tco_0294551 [Tanacetum coccineum]